MRRLVILCIFLATAEKMLACLPAPIRQETVWTRIKRVIEGRTVYTWEKRLIKAAPYDIYEPSQKVFIYWRDNKEDLVLEVTYKGKVTKFACIIPVPVRPQVRILKGAPFHELSRLMPTPLPKPVAPGGPPGAPKGKAPVTVLERKHVGIYYVTVLTAWDSMALINWLNKNNYLFPERGKSIIRDYVKRGWVFVAMRIAIPTAAVQRGLNEGVIEPLRLTFKSKQIVYPLKIMRLNADTLEVLMYVAAPFKVKAEKFEEEFMRKVHPRDLLAGYPTLHRLIRQPSIVTKLRAILEPDEITADLVLHRRWL